MSNALSTVRLISTDFDGTLVEHDAPAPFSPDLLGVFSALREKGVRWVINTGRSLSSLEEGLECFAFPIHPDFVITTERELFQPAPNGHGWVDFGDWNTVCARRHDELFAVAGPALREVARFVQQQTGAELRYGRRTEAHPVLDEPAGIVACDDEEMDRIVARIEPLRAEFPQFSYQRNSIYLSFCHAAYDKGTTLAELGRRLGIGPENIFAVGDHQNDLPMLTGVHARQVACPGNATDRVREAVQAAGGYVARASYSAGVLEALAFYCEGARLSGAGVGVGD